MNICMHLNVHYTPISFIIQTHFFDNVNQIPVDLLEILDGGDVVISDETEALGNCHTVPLNRMLVAERDSAFLSGR